MHTFGRKSDVGGGIRRQVCETCGLVEIDLGSVDTVEESKLFASVRSESMFARETASELEAAV